ncbi:helix-turn-helix domain-containing protein [Crossiella equi]|uniref:helix-turn-helix domain-containing protein n=1 Tax=Crossiella equi TaxID=130796 RepID=UPI003558093B
MNTYEPTHGLGMPVAESTTSTVATSSGTALLPLPTTHRRPSQDSAANNEPPPDDRLASTPAQVLFTPAQAAEMLQIRESWLRRQAARRQVPCTFLGKHLRFSRADIDRIVADAARPAATGTRAGAGTSPRRHRRSRSQINAPTRRPTK